MIYYFDYLTNSLRDLAVLQRCLYFMMAIGFKTVSPRIVRQKPLESSDINQILNSIVFKK